MINKNELIISMILGDGSISKNLQFVINHAPKQRDYLEWKAKLLGKELGILLPIKMYKTTFSYYTTYFSSVSHLKMIRELLYTTNGDKSLEYVFPLLNSPLSLAIWFMDDGSVFKRRKKHKDGSEYFLAPKLKLCTHSYSKKDNELILKWMNDTFNIEGYIVIERKRNREGSPKYYTLNFNVENSNKIWNLISEFVLEVPSMMNKFNFFIEFYSSH